MAAVEGGLDIEEDILVEGHRGDSLQVADEERSQVDTDHDAVAEVRRIVIEGTLDLADWYYRVQRWILLHDRCCFGSGPIYLYTEQPL